MPIPLHPLVQTVGAACQGCADEEVGASAHSGRFARLPPRAGKYCGEAALYAVSKICVDLQRNGLSFSKLRFTNPGLENYILQIPSTMPVDSNKKQEHSFPEDQSRWFAIRVKFRREKVVVKRLEDQGIQAYLPLQTVVRVYASKTKRLRLPLINGYAFVCITRKEYVPVLETHDVVDFVRTGGILSIIPEGEIELLRRVVGESMPMTAEPLSFAEGDEVEIISGRLTGVRGTLVKKQNRHTFVIALANLQHELHIQIDLALLSKVPKRAKSQPSSSTDHLPPPSGASDNSKMDETL